MVQPAAALRERAAGAELDVVGMRADGERARGRREVEAAAGPRAGSVVRARRSSEGSHGRVVEVGGQVDVPPEARLAHTRSGRPSRRLGAVPAERTGP
jgi:hypothetical protein